MRYHRHDSPQRIGAALKDASFYTQATSSDVADQVFVSALADGKVYIAYGSNRSGVENF